MESAARMFSAISLGFILTLVPAIACAQIGFNDTSNRTPVTCEPSGPTDADIVLVTLGQSISANEGETGYTPVRNVVNFNINDGRCYGAADPLLGASFKADGKHIGSIWGRLCDKLLKTGQWTRCLVASIAQGDTSMSQWAPGGNMNPLIERSVTGLRKHKIEPTLFLYGQGESDASVHANPAAYQKNFNAMADDIHRYTKAPILIAVETICYGVDTGPDLQFIDDATRVAKWIGQEAIQQAQRSVIDPSRGIFPGPNLDFINDQVGRWDGCHLSTYGLEVAAEQWKYYLLQAIGQKP
jgi:Carbohydrate esterase, sialic acid-specific acetylesterase